MKKILLLFVVLLGTIVLLCSCDCKHEEYSQANCNEPSICLKCGETVSNALGHSDGEWITDREPNCTEDGSKHQVCSVCEATIKTETLTKLGHTDGEWITDKEANCTEDGSKHQVCSVCNDTIETEVIPAAGHEYAKTVTKATAESNASILFTCKTCMYSYTEIISPINVIVELTGSGVTISGSVYYSRSFEVTANGGFGKYQYRFESGSNLLQDYTTDNTITVYGNSFIDYATIKITVMDEIGQKTVYEIKGNGSYVNSYVVYE